VDVWPLLSVFLGCLGGCMAVTKWFLGCLGECMAITKLFLWCFFGCMALLNCFYGVLVDVGPLLQ